jgi:hypothetical protein
MSAATRTLSESRDSLGASNLENAIYRGEINAEVEARSRDDTAKTGGAESLLNPVASFSVE